MDGSYHSETDYQIHCSITDVFLHKPELNSLLSQLLTAVKSDSVKLLSQTLWFNVAGEEYIFKLLSNNFPDTICKEILTFMKNEEFNINEYYFDIKSGCWHFHTANLLMVGIVNEASACTKFLCDLMDVNKQSKSNCGDFTPLMVAVMLQNLTIVRILLACHDIDINFVNRDIQKSSTALIKASSMNAPEIVGELVKSPEIDVNLRSPDDGATALMSAIWWSPRSDYAGVLKNVDILLNAPGIDTALKDNSGFTALNYCMNELKSPNMLPRERLAHKRLMNLIINRLYNYGECLSNLAADNSMVIYE